MNATCLPGVLSGLVYATSCATSMKTLLRLGRYYPKIQNNIIDRLHVISLVNFKIENPVYVAISLHWP